MNTRRWANPNQGCTHIPQNILEVIWNILFIIKVKILVLTTGRKRPPQLCWLLRLGLLSYFGST